jgi:hypothetical protein
LWLNQLPDSNFEHFQPAQRQQLKNDAFYGVLFLAEKQGRLAEKPGNP